jgi:hypothetical protein
MKPTTTAVLSHIGQHSHLPRARMLEIALRLDAGAVVSTELNWLGVHCPYAWLSARTRSELHQAA